MTAVLPRQRKTSAPPVTVPRELLDPLISLSAEMLSDLEKVRIANENRFRQLTRSGADADGLNRGFELPVDHPDVLRVGTLVNALVEGEASAIANLSALYRQHPMYAWSKTMRGVGDKQAARLLASVGDPFLRPELTRADGTVEPVRPRPLVELWAYCGYHVFIEEDGVGVAAYRKRGEKSNWNGDAKMRAYLVAATCVKQLSKPCGRPEDEPERAWASHVDDCRCGKYRRIYDETREFYAGRLHPRDCVRCGPSGKPALKGSPMSAAHLQARGIRAVAKEILADMWRTRRDECLAAGLVTETVDSLSGEKIYVMAG